MHYIYDGDVSKLNRLYSDDIEIKVFTGNSSLRRKLTKCNAETINHLGDVLPKRKEKAVLNFDAVQNEKALRTIITKNLNKEYHSATKPSVDFIFKTLEDAYNVYAAKKEENIKQIADEYKELIPEKLYVALYNYKVKIENDKNYVA